MMKSTLFSGPACCRFAAAIRWFSTRPGRWFGALSGLVLLALWLAPGRASAQIGFTGAGALIDRRQPISSYPVLYLVLGTTYGGDGVSQSSIPIGSSGKRFLRLGVMP